MPSAHKYKNPIPFRPPAGEREWLTAYAEKAGVAVNAVLTDALRLLRERVERNEAGTPADTTTEERS